MLVSFFISHCKSFLVLFNFFTHNDQFYRKAMEVLVVSNADAANVDYSFEDQVTKVAYLPFLVSGDGHCVL